MTDLDRTRAAIEWFDLEPGRDYDARLRLLADAARRYVLLAETSQRVEWCKVHKSRALIGMDRCEFMALRMERHLTSNQDAPCSIVSKWLTDYEEE